MAVIVCQTCYRKVDASYEPVYAAWDDSAMCGDCYEAAWPAPIDDEQDGNYAGEDEYGR